MEKNKGKQSRVNNKVDSGFVLSGREFRAGMNPSCVGKTKRNSIDNSASKIKQHVRDWADSFPKKIDGAPSGFTPAVREVFKAIVFRYLTSKGYSVFSYETLGDAAGCHRDTAREAINLLRERGLIQWKTGRGWGRKNRRNHANQYTANFWVFINPETGTLIVPPYSTGAYEWQDTAAAFRARLVNGPQSENVTMVASVPAGHKGNGAENKSGDMLGPDTPIAQGNGETVMVQFVQFSKLAEALKIGAEELKEAIRGQGPVESRLALEALCKDDIFTYGKPRVCVLDHKPARGTTTYGHVVVHGDESETEFVNGGRGRLAFDELKPSSCLAIEYRVSSSYQKFAAEKVKALKA